MSCVSRICVFVDIRDVQYWNRVKIFIILTKTVCISLQIQRIYHPQTQTKLYFDRASTCLCDSDSAALILLNGTTSALASLSSDLFYAI